MNAKFHAVWSVSHDEWTACADADARSSVFQTPEWGDVLMEAGIAYSVRAIGARFEGSAAIVLPFAQMWQGRASGLWALESMPLSGYGGPIIVGDVNTTAAATAIERMCLDWRLGAQSVSITGHPERSLELTGKFVSRRLVAHVLDIDRGMDGIMRGYNQNFRRGLKAARKADVRVRSGTTFDDLMTYYSLYENSLERWGARATSRHPRQLFNALRRLPEGRFRVWLGSVRGSPAAGIVVLYKGKTAYYWHGAFHAAYSREMPAKAVFHAAIADLAARGFTRLDLLPSGGHDGVVQFKESMGARACPFDEFTWVANWPRKLMAALRSGLFKFIPA